MLANIRLVVDKCREHGVYLNMYSNATVLDGERLRKIADRVHKLWISFDCADREVFEKLRVRAKFDTVVDHIREIIAVATELGVPLGFVAVLLRQNLELLPGLVDFLADLGASEAAAELRVQPMSGMASGCASSDVHAYYSEAEICAWLDRACERAQARSMLFLVTAGEPFRREVAPIAPRLRGVVPDILTKLTQTIHERYPGFCAMSAMHLKIKPDGNVYPCCVGPDELLMGNVKEQSVEEIWNGPRYREFRRRMFARDYPEPCRECEHLVANPHFASTETPPQTAGESTESDSVFSHSPA
jgi:radical SAM protein with 4Fe4S-binding SPASM domain